MKSIILDFFSCFIMNDFEWLSVQAMFAFRSRIVYFYGSTPCTGEGLQNTQVPRYLLFCEGGIFSALALTYVYINKHLSCLTYGRVPTKGRNYVGTCVFWLILVALCCDIRVITVTWYPLLVIRGD